METTRRSPVKEIVCIVKDVTIMFLIPEAESFSFRQLSLYDQSSIINRIAEDGYTAYIKDNAICIDLVSDQDEEKGLIKEAITNIFGYPVKMIPEKQFQILAGPVKK